MSIAKFPFVSEDGNKHCLRLWINNKTKKRHIEICYEYKEDGKTWEGAWAFEASKEKIKKLLTDNLFLNEDVRNYFSRVIKNLAFL